MGRGCACNWSLAHYRSIVLRIRSFYSICPASRGQPRAHLPPPPTPVHSLSQFPCPSHSPAVSYIIQIVSTSSFQWYHFCPAKLDEPKGGSCTGVHMTQRASLCHTRVAWGSGTWPQGLWGSGSLSSSFQLWTHLKRRATVASPRATSYATRSGARSQLSIECCVFNNKQMLKISLRTNLNPRPPTSRATSRLRRQYPVRPRIFLSSNVSFQNLISITDLLIWRQKRCGVLAGDHFEAELHFQE